MYSIDDEIMVFITSFSIGLQIYPNRIRLFGTDMSIIITNCAKVNHKIFHSYRSIIVFISHSTYFRFDANTNFKFPVISSFPAIQTNTQHKTKSASFPHRPYHRKKRKGCLTTQHTQHTSYNFRYTHGYLCIMYATSSFSIYAEWFVNIDIKSAHGLSGEKTPQNPESQRMFVWVYKV